MKEYSEKAKAKTVVVGGISAKVSELQAANKDAFSIPEWFLYTSRAFLTLEVRVRESPSGAHPFSNSLSIRSSSLLQGICLTADEDFSIISECFPYVAKRLLSDDSERAQAALKNMIYGAAGVFDPKTVVDTVEGFQSFQSSTKGGAHAQKESATIDTAVLKEGADLILATNGSNALQDLTTDIGSDAVTALVKGFLSDLPFTPRASRDQFLQLTESEQKATEILGLLNSRNAEEEKKDEGLFPNLPSLPTPPPVNPENVGTVINAVREYAPGGQRIARKLALQLAKKSSHNLENLDKVKGVEKEVLKRVKRTAETVAKNLEEA